LALALLPLHPLMSDTTPLYLVGPTAVGKTAIALALARALQGEIISVDSMQVYRGLDIGTAKPTAAERAEVPHHLIDVHDVAEPFDAARFVALAQPIVAAIQARGRRPIFCGGTGLYLKAYLEGLGTAPPADPALRAELEQQPLPALLEELALRDPVLFRRIDPRNPRRVRRAVEVIRLTGRPFSELRASWRGQGDLNAGDAPTGARPVIWGLERDVHDLHRRIQQRVESMFAQGWVEETRAMQERGLEANPSASQAIGYRQVLAYLRKERTMGETQALVQTKTRQLAKRQRTWFRHQLPVRWCILHPDDPPEAVAAQLLQQTVPVPR
jgi:tRNA dimethylallyltransferase